jgi:regulatory protein
MVSQGSKTSSPGSEVTGLEPHDEARLKRRSKATAKRRPLDEASLSDMALTYVARFATTGAKLEAFLARKVRERGAAQDADGRAVDLDISGLVTRLVELGYVDDEAYARSKSRDLNARGYGARRVDQALRAAGVGEQMRFDSAPNEAANRSAAALLAKKRRFGPFGDRPADEAPDARRKRREKQVAALLRAGHLYEDAGFIVDASTPDEVEEWLNDAQEDQNDA